VGIKNAEFDADFDSVEKGIREKVTEKRLYYCVQKFSNSASNFAFKIPITNFCKKTFTLFSLALFANFKAKRR
jgi:hypothetical protein